MCQRVSNYGGRRINSSVRRMGATVACRREEQRLDAKAAQRVREVPPHAASGKAHFARVGMAVALKHTNSITDSCHRHDDKCGR